MSIEFRRARMAMVAFGCLMGAQSASSYECDTANVLINQEGVLSLDGYSFGAAVANTRALVAPIVNGACQSRVSVMVMDPAKTNNVGDGQMSRTININVPDPDTQLLGTYSTRFQVQPPIFANKSLNRQLIFREIEFTPASNDPDSMPGRLQFSAETGDGQHWLLKSRFLGNAWAVDLGFVMSNNTSAPRFEVLVEYVLEYSLVLYRQVPKLKVTYIKPDGTRLVSGLTLPYTMIPIKQRQGLLGQANLPLNSVFKIENCLKAGCAVAPQ